MAASYPTSVKSFSTKSTTDTVEAAHPNELQDEVTAVESALLNGVAHDLLPATTSARNVGSSALRWLASYFTTLNVSGASTLASVTASAAILSSSASAGVGYTAGAGGTVTQATSKSTGVTLDKVTGNITMHAAALAADTSVSFTLTNSAIAAADLVVVTHHASGTAGAYTVHAQANAGSATVTVRNVTAGSLSEAISLKFAVIKGAVT